MKGTVPELERRLLLAQDDAIRLATLLELAREHSAAFRNREGLRAAKEALGIARRNQDRLGTGRALAVATLCHFQRADYLAAVATGLDAVDAYADGDVVGRSRARQSIALALFSIEAFDLAESMAERSVADARAGNDAEREAYACSVYGAILGDRGKFNQARRQFRIAARYYRMAGDLLRLKKSASNLGHTYRKQGLAQERRGKAQAARMHWAQAIRVYRIALGASSHDPDDAIILGSMAECHCRMGNAEEAYADAGRALDLARKTRNPAILANCHLWEGHALAALGDLEAAQRALERSCDAAGGIEHDAVLVTCLQALAALATRRGDAVRAKSLEKRAGEVAWERDTYLAGIREQLRAVWRPLDKLSA